MRNYSAVCPMSTTISWSADQKIDNQSTFQKIVEKFNILFENPVGTTVENMTPSEQRVIADFLRYAGQCRRRSSNFAKDHPGSFVYINLNTGKLYVFVTDYGYGDIAAEFWVL